MHQCQQGRGELHEPLQLAHGDTEIADTAVGDGRDQLDQVCILPVQAPASILFPVESAGQPAGAETGRTVSATGQGELYPIYACLATNGVADTQSVLAVLGKASAVNSIERLDLKIYDPAESLRVARRDESTAGSGSATTAAPGSSMNGTGDTDDDDMDGGYGGDQAGGRQSTLMLRLLCRHGMSPCPSFLLMQRSVYLDVR